VTPSDPFLAPVHPSGGQVHLVGAGPGDPDLLTLKALRLLREADVVVHDHLVAEGILALIPASTRRVFVGKKGGGFCCPQHHIEETLVDLARQGLHVVRLKGGDPFIFGRGGEELEALAAAGIPCAVVPGVTSALGAAAEAGIPLTHRRLASGVVFLTGHEEPGKAESAVPWEDYARVGATLCIYMGMKNLESITRRLLAGGLAAETPAAVVQAATTPSQRRWISSLGRIAREAEEGGFTAPAIVIIGEVVGLEEALLQRAAVELALP
jgi:uroporphyrin-III C-methyltransferase